MQIGMIGLGRMGANMVRRLMRGGHDCVVFDRSPQASEALAKEGAVPAASLEDLTAATRTTRMTSPARDGCRPKDSTMWTWERVAASGDSSGATVS